jgi:hypothetical protein
MPNPRDATAPVPQSARRWDTACVRKPQITAVASEANRLLADIGGEPHEGSGFEDEPTGPSGPDGEGA